MEGIYLHFTDPHYHRIVLISRLDIEMATDERIVTYKYTPISLDSTQTEIRLVTILPGTFLDEVCCTITSAHLSDSPS